ncbi:MAG: universal stress protein [Pseudomonadota bacterium]
MMTKAGSELADFLPLRRVLAVCQGKDQDVELLKSAADLAGRNGASLSVLSVLEPPSDAHELARGVGLDMEAILARSAKQRHEAVRALVGSTLENTEPKIDVAVGKAFIEIVRHVMAERIDMVVKVAEPLHGSQWFLFASTDQHLLRKCPCAVWLRRPDTPVKLGRVIVAVDVDLEDATEPQTLAALNRSVMDVASQITAAEDASVDVLHAWDAPGEGLVRTWSGDSNPNTAAEAYVSAVHNERATALKSLTAEAAQRTKAAGFVGPEPLPVLARGPARIVIPDQCEALEPDVLVIGTVARTGLRGVIIGNTAEDVLNSTECSVVAVKPPGFITPLEID